MDKVRKIKDRSVFKLRRSICLTQIMQRIVRLWCEYGLLEKGNR